MDKKFHLLAVGISTSEKQGDFAFYVESLRVVAMAVTYVPLHIKVLISDCSHATINGFKEIYKDSENIICWAHVVMNIKKKTFHRKYNQELILKDIKILQLAPSMQVFKTGSDLLFNKWIEKEPEFMQYFKPQWLDKNNTWFEGAKNFTPSTNNALEATNGRIKTDFTFRERATLSQFKNRIMDIVNKFSLEYKNGEKRVSMERAINKELWSKAYVWAKTRKFVQTEITDNGQLYYVSEGKTEALNQADKTIYKDMNWSFDEMAKSMFSIWVLSFLSDETKWRESTCTCPSFFKEFTCKHVIGIALRLKIVEAPPDVRLVEHNKKGRPAKAKKALIRQ